MELREKIAALFDICRTGGQYSNSGEFADFVLNFPEIKDALFGTVDPNRARMTITIERDAYEANPEGFKGAAWAMIDDELKERWA